MFNTFKKALYGWSKGKHQVLNKTLDLKEKPYKIAANLFFMSKNFE